jgi:hypothetical protein
MGREFLHGSYGSHTIPWAIQCGVERMLSTGRQRLSNLLLILDSLEITYDQADFKLYFSNSKYPTCPLLRKDYLSTVQSGGKLSMCFSWMISKDYQLNYLSARRMANQNDKCLVIPPIDQVWTNNYRLLLLDTHNLIASLTRIVPSFQKPCRYGMWKLFVRNEGGQEDTNSRQSPHRTRSPSYASRHSSTSEVHRRQSLPSIRGCRAAMTSGPWGDF